MITAELGSRADPIGVMEVGENGVATALAITNPNRRLSQQAGDECVAPRALNEVEMRKRSQCETIIRSGWNTFLEVGQALSRIRWPPKRVRNWGRIRNPVESKDLGLVAGDARRIAQK